MKSFNEWMNENVGELKEGNKRFHAFNPRQPTLPHPIKLADHVWNECAKVYTLKLDSFLTQLRLTMPDNPRATSMINQLKEEMIKAMIANSVGFVPEGESTNENAKVEPVAVPPSLKLI